MSKAKAHKKGSSKAKRLSFPADEKKHPWLSQLLEAFYIVDRGVADSIDAEKRKGRKPACSKGCTVCCRTHNDIPIYPLELAGLSWYATEKIDGREREVLRSRLENYRKNDPCPFLMEDSCAVYQVRPMACRQFNVFGRSCEEGEDPFYSRREDVMDPVKRHVDQAFFIMLPFYGIVNGPERIRIIETGAFHRMAKELHSCNWKSLAEKIY